MAVKTIRLDIGGPKGNAWYIMGTVRHLAEVSGKDAEAIICKMKEGNYENLLRTYLRHFPFVRLYSHYELPIDPDLYEVETETVEL